MLKTVEVIERLDLIDRDRLGDMIRQINIPDFYKCIAQFSGLRINDNEWTGVALTYDTTVKSDSMSYMKNKLFRIVVGTKQAAYEIGCGLDINNLEVLLGRRFEEERVNTNMTHDLTICRALYGQIADFAYKPNYSTFDECKRILSISPTSKLKMYDELNILRREEINNNNTIYSHQINYNSDKGLKI